MDEEVGDKARKKRDKASERTADGQSTSSGHLYILIIVIIEIVASQLSMTSFALIGSGVSYQNSPLVTSFPSHSLCVPLLSSTL